MNESSPAGENNIEHHINEKEKEKNAKKQVWFIDDNISGIDSIIGALHRYVKNINFIHFNNGEKALEVIRDILKNKRELPVAILVDYQLDEDVENPKYKTGLDVIRDLKKVCSENNADLPQIVGFSTSKTSNKRLVDEGAASSLDKMNLREIRGFMEVIERPSNSKE